MTDTGSPPDSDFEKETAELAALVGGARKALPSPEQLASVGSKLGPILGATGAIGAGAAMTGELGTAAAVKTSGTAGLAKFAGVVVACSVAGGGVWLASRSEQAPSQPTERSQPTVSVRITPLPRTAPLPAEVEAGDGPANEALPAPSERSATAVPTARPSVERRAAETQLLRQAQSLVKTDPTRALALTREHRRRFPNGALAQERDVIAIEALAKLGRTEEAKTRAREFTEQHPGSAHGKKIEATTKDK